MSKKLLWNIQKMQHFNRTDLPLEELLSDESIFLIQQTLTKVVLPKGHRLLEQSEGIKHAYLIKKGIIRVFIPHENKEITFEFAREKDILSTSMGYFYQRKSYESFELLENCTLYRIDLDAIKTLFYQSVEICNWARQFTEVNAIKTQKQLIDILVMTPEERYLDLFENDRSIFQRVPLKQIASYIGISPISLSRIRARIK